MHTIPVLIILFVLLTQTLAAQQGSTFPAYYESGTERLRSYTFRTYTDPVRLGWLLLESGKNTWSRDPKEWDRSAESYSYRVASQWGERIVRNTVQLGFETMLHEDSRYRPTMETGFRRRILFAIRSSVVAYKPDGSVQPAYGLIMAGAAAATVSSTWRPQSFGADTLFCGIGESAIDRMGNNLLTEFAPDLKRFGQKTWRHVFRK
jgi:hypothetical protein